MRNTFSFLAALVIVGALASGCANTERKFGRGMSNFAELFRAGEFRRTVEQTGLWDGPDAARSVGVVRGFNRTMARTGIGLYEMVTAPIPPYDPVFTDYLAPGPVYPDSYTPGLPAGSLFATDTYIGFAGGDVLPIVPGSRFAIFDTH